MDAETFFDEADVQRILRRARRASSVPLSLHSVRGGAEGENVDGWGGCDACTHILNLPWGRQACRRSREDAALDALRRGKPVPFLCHMGFSCVAVPALVEEDGGRVLTFGPFCPAEVPEALARDALAGLHALERQPSEELPFDLGDIPLVDAESVPAVAEWLFESLQGLWQARKRAEDEEAGAAATVAENQPPRYGPKHPSRSLRDPYQGADIAAALGGGDQERARGLVKGLIADTTSAKRLTLPVKRARAIALASAVLEAAERAGLNTSGSWERFPDLQPAVREARNEGELGLAVMRVLGPIKRGSKDAASGAYPFEALNRIVTEHLAAGITLNEAAEALGQTPTAITRRLQRKFGLSYSEYVGRIRVDLAKGLLRDTKLSINEVARRVGLTDAGNFSKLFRRHEGASPTQFRKLFGRRA